MVIIPKGSLFEFHDTYTQVPSVGVLALHMFKCSKNIKYDSESFLPFFLFIETTLCCIHFTLLFIRCGNQNEWAA